MVKTMPMADYNIVDQERPDPDSLTYKASETLYVPSWVMNQFTPGRFTPSMDDKANDSPAICTNEEFERDQEAGFNRIGEAVYGSKKGLDKD